MFKKRFFISLIILMGIIKTAPALDADAMVAQIDKNLTPPSFEAYRRIINEEPNGNKKEYVFYSVKKGRDRIAMVYMEPAGDRGKTTLRIGDNMWLYIQSVGKPVRLASQQSLTGGVFNNADLMKIDFSAEYSAFISNESEDQYILELKAKTPAVAYDKLIMTVDKKYMLPNKIDCYSASGMLIKSLQYKAKKDFGGGLVIPSVLETTGPLYPGYKSTMITLSMKSRVLPDEVFTLNYMPKLEGLRK